MTYHRAFAGSSECSRLRKDYREAWSESNEVKKVVHSGCMCDLWWRIIRRSWLAFQSA